MDASELDAQESGRPLKIALVLRRFSTRGGTEKFAVDLARWLASRGHEVHVFAGRFAPALRDERHQQGWTLHPLHLPRLGRLGRVAKALSFVRAARAVPLEAFDVVQGFDRADHHHLFRAGGGAHRAYLAARTGLGAWLARVSPWEWLESHLDARAARSARWVVCNSELAARDVQRWHGLSAERVRVVRNGVDAARFAPDPLRRAGARAWWRVPDGGRVALFLGSGYRRKGLGTALRAFARVAQHDDRLVVMGRERHLLRYRLLARWLGVARQVVFHGAVSAPEQWIPGADATVLATRYDPAANTTLEAMACGVPPVTTAMDGNSEVVPDRRLVVDDPRDARALGRALVVAWKERAELGVRCREVALEWPVSRNGRLLESLYWEWVHEQERAKE